MAVDAAHATVHEPSWAEPGRGSVAAGADEASAATATISPLGLLQLLRTSGPTLLGHVELYGELIALEWTLERRRLQQMLLLGVFAFSCWLALLLLLFATALLLSWPTPYRTLVVISLLGSAVAGLAYAAYRIRQLAQAGRQSFSTLRSEFAEDLHLLRKQL